MAASGYEWRDDPEGKSRLVAKAGPSWSDTQLDAGLFRRFAMLEASPKAIADFASEYGNLFDSATIEQLARREDGTYARGVSFLTWTQNIADLRAVAALWEHVQTRNLPKLRKVVHWTERSVGYRLVTPLRESDTLLAHHDLPRMGFGRIERGDVVLPGQIALQLEVNKRLADHPPVASLAWTPDSEQRLLIRPPHLLAAIWLQFAQTITGVLELVTCEGCGTHFQRGPGARRADATTCSDSCRQRKKRARAAGVGGG